MKQKIFKYKDIYKQNKLKKTAIYQGMWGLKAVQSGIITDKQLETVRKTISRLTKKLCKLWIRVKCNTPITKKSVGVRMGKGVGSISSYICNVKLGTIIFEVFFTSTISQHNLKNIFINLSKSLSIKTKLVKKII